MPLKLYKRDLPVDIESAYILGISDLHIGSPEHDALYLNELLSWIKDTPNAYIVLNGDLCDVATKDSKSDSYEATLTPDEQRKYVKRVFEPVKDRVLGVTLGNHEDRIKRSTSIDISGDLADHLGCPYAREGLLLQVRVGKGKNGKSISYLIYATHGWSMARTPGAKVNMAVSLSNIVYADVYIAGHTHSKYVFEKVFYLPDERNKQVRRVKQLFASSGSILEYGGYAQARGYPPGAKGIPRIRLSGTRKDVHASI
jgi:predicted phosphodiesterase